MVSGYESEALTAVYYTMYACSKDIKLWGKTVLCLKIRPECFKEYICCLLKEASTKSARLTDGYCVL